MGKLSLLILSATILLVACGRGGGGAGASSSKMAVLGRRLANKFPPYQ